MVDYGELRLPPERKETKRRKRGKPIGYYSFQGEWFKSKTPEEQERLRAHYKYMHSRIDNTKGRHIVPIVAIDMYGKATKYRTVKDAHEGTGVGMSSIRSCVWRNENKYKLHDEHRTLKGYMFYHFEGRAWRSKCNNAEEL